MHVHYTCAWYLPWSEKVWMPWSWDHGEHESPRELNPGPMQEQQGLALLLTTDTALHFWYNIFFNEYLLFGTKNGALKERLQEIDVLQISKTYKCYLLFSLLFLFTIIGNKVTGLPWPEVSISL